MARTKLRSRRDVNDRIRALAGPLATALRALPAQAADPAVIEAIWQAEGLGTLLWALGLVELPAFDSPFDAEWLLATPTAHGNLRARAEIEHAQESARLWHWRARTHALRQGDEIDLPPAWTSFEQLIAVAAMHGYERGLLPSPVRGDFAAFGTGYRELSAVQAADAFSIAYERHRALNWLCGEGRTWDDTTTDT